MRCSMLKVPCTCNRNRANLRQLSLDLHINAALGEFGGHSESILDGIRIRRSVGDEADALDSQQRRSAVFSVIEAFLEIGEGAARK